MQGQGTLQDQEIMGRIQRERQDARQSAFEEAAGLLESYSTNTIYRKALKLGARLIRDHIEKVNRT